LIIFPALTSMRVFKSFLSVTVSSAVISVVCFVFGITFSYSYSAPPGASIVTVNLAAFALFEDAGCVNVSARSYGEFNVQLVMEYLGGGGHLTMAGAQLKDMSMQEAVKSLQEAIDRYYKETVSDK
ncbi:MAG: metal ABC transporter permease, partial [Clostridia bacterium]|nr:metal ABC transporter permease [Clostridia bacterium]